MEKKYNNHTFFIKTLLILHKLQYHLLKSLKRNINSSTVAAKALQNNKEKKKRKKLVAQEVAIKGESTGALL